MHIHKLVYTYSHSHTQRCMCALALEDMIQPKINNNQYGKQNFPSTLG